MADAIDRGDIDAIRARVLAEPDCVHARDEFGDTILMSAIDNGDAELVDFLLQHNADPNVEVDDGFTCLMSAIESAANATSKIVELLLAAGADIHGVGINGWTPLHLAASRNALNIARLLIDAGADVNRRTEIDGGNTPLMEAASQGHPEIVRLLLDCQADPSLRNYITQRTPYEMASYAAQGPDKEVEHYLREHAEQLDAHRLEGIENADMSEEFREQIRQSLEKIDMASQYVENAERLRVTGRHAEVMQILSDHGRARDTDKSN